MAGSIGTAYFNVAPNMSGVQGKITGGLKGTGSAFAEQFGAEINGRSAFIVGAIAGIASAATSKALGILSDSIGTAVKRVDTLNSAQKTFQYMGFAAEDSAAATKAITKSIEGLPTPLDSAIRGMTSLAATYGDVKLGQKVFTALNDAILGFGGSASMVDNAIQQISQLPLDGPLDAQTWNSLRNSGLTPVLVAMGKDMGKSVSQLKEDFGSGKLTVQDFVNELTKLDTQGGGGLVALNKIASNATSGISTGFQNMQTAVARGMASIIQTIGQKNISTAIAKIGSGFESTLKKIATAITFMAQHKDVFAPIAVGIGAIVAAMTAWATITKIMTIAQTIFNAVLAANPISIIILAITGLVAGLVYFFTQTTLGKQVFQDFGNVLKSVFGSIMAVLTTVGTFFKTTFTNIQAVVSGVVRWVAANWPLLLGILTGPVGLAVLFVVRNFQTIKDSVANVIGSVASFFGSLPGRIRNAIGNLGGMLYNTGRDMIQGLLNGAGSLLSTIGQFFLNKLPGWIQTPFKKALGIRSPSKVFAGFGANISQGLANGVNDKAGVVTSAIGKLADNAINSLGSSNLTADLTASIQTPTAQTVTAGYASDSANPQIVQNNNIYNQVDLDSVSRDLAWQVRR